MREAELVLACFFGGGAIAEGKLSASNSRSLLRARGVRGRST